MFYGPEEQQMVSNRFQTLVEAYRMVHRPELGPEERERADNLVQQMESKEQILPEELDDFEAKLGQIIHN
jgi:hypothetical protein